MWEFLVDGRVADTALQAVGIIDYRGLLDKAELIFGLLAYDLQNLNHLVVDAHGVRVLIFLLLGLVALREGEAGLAWKQEPVGVVRFVLRRILFFNFEKQFCHDATQGPNVNFTIVKLLGQDYFWTSVPPTANMSG